ncbi:hypothetical protein K7432_013685 [Basidiobolus ranarum]|uniref:Uncharacterized protein n=1 Tax=Basidiobolus ranarum TaxID=34480 RepID=A0ABR2VRG8_9FUNG
MLGEETLEEAEKSFSLSSVKRIRTVKMSVSTIKWKEQYRPVLKELAHNVNDLVTHTFAFLKFIFMKEFAKDDDFGLKEYRSTDKSRLSAKVRQAREKINTYKEEYCQLASYAFYMLPKIYEDNNMKSFNCFPLRKGFIPSYMTIDTNILNYHILKNKNFTGNKVDIWGSVVNPNFQALKSQNAKTMKFEVAIETNGVGMSILKKTLAQPEEAL